MGVRTDSRRAGQARDQGLGDGDPHALAPKRARSGSAAVGADLGGVPPQPGTRDPGTDFFTVKSIWLRTLYVFLRDRAPHQAGPLGRSRQEPRLRLGRPAGEESVLRPHRQRKLPVPDKGPGPWSSITKNTYRVLSQMDSTVNKSVARIPCAWIAEELPPGRLRPPPSRTEPASAQERADRRRRDPDPELDQLAPNPHAPLSRVLPAHPKDQLPNVSRRVAASRRWRSDGRSTSCGRARGASAGASAGSLRTKTNPGEGEPG
jgi:hypothetical protein